jgi:ribosomal protein S18 acetylase RimI-like enzyme
MNKALKIENTTTDDLEFIYWMFEKAIDYYKRNNYPVWNGYDKKVLQTAEVNEKRQYKIVVENQLAFAFSVMYTDELLWREKENGNALYLHRIIVNPNFIGRKLYGVALDWAIKHSKIKNLEYIRMDIRGDNPNMLAYYESYGFKFVEYFCSSDDPYLPSPHRNMFFALLEYKI